MRRSFVRDWLRDIGGVVTGANFAFGRGKAGSSDVLAALCRSSDRACESVGSVREGTAAASSSRIRAALEVGDCKARLLTRPYAIEGVSRPGKRQDPALPLRDACLELCDYLRPRAGVYAVRGRLADGRALGGSAYLSVPSMGNANPLLELFLIDLAACHLGGRIDAQLIAHFHDVQEIYDPPALRRRIVHDCTEARTMVSSLLH